MDKRTALETYNTRIGSIVNVSKADEVDFCSLSHVIDNSISFGFKFSLFPSDDMKTLLSTTDTSYLTTLDDLESMVSEQLK
jgi:hypothetical protein